MGCCCSSSEERRNRHGDYETDSAHANDPVLLRLHDDVEVRTIASCTESTISEPVACVRNIGMFVRCTHARLKADTRPNDEDPATADTTELSDARKAEIQTWMAAASVEGALPTFDAALHRSLAPSTTNTSVSTHPSRAAAGFAAVREGQEAAAPSPSSPPPVAATAVGPRDDSAATAGPTQGPTTDTLVEFEPAGHGTSWASAGALSVHVDGDGADARSEPSGGASPLPQETSPQAASDAL